jgi:uncharacterized membrane protein YqaE (UPF0057 family)
MIKKITAITLLSAVLFSCSTSNEVVSNGFLQKRKYNKGWYSNNSSKVNSSKELNAKEIYEIEEETQNELAQAVVVKKEIKSVSREYISKEDVVVKSESTILASNNKKGEVIVYASEIILQEQDAIVLENLKRVSETKSVEIKEISSKNVGGGSDLGLLILVFLSIFIPPLAVFLVDGLGQPFWINLVLALLGIGVFGLLGTLGVLAYLAAIIHALIIVLG